MSEGWSAVLTTSLLTDAGLVALAPLHPEVHALGDGLEAASVTRRVLDGDIDINNKFSLLWGEAQLCLPYDCL